MDELLEEITIYHKENGNWIRYNEIASVRNTSYLNRNRTGTTSTDNVLIRNFNVDGYNSSWKCDKGDVIYSGNSDYSIIKAPLTELRELYGKENVFEVSSVEKFIFDDLDIKELNHIKIGGR